MGEDRGGKKDYLGEFEHLVLLAVMRLGEEAYGAPIRQIIEERAERSVSFGALYSTLRRLRKKGYVDVTAALSGGRARQVYRVSGSGREALESAQRRLRRMTEGLWVLPGG